MTNEYEGLFDAPVPAPLWLPAPWITTTGPVDWRRVPREWGRHTNRPCEDCVRCILDDLAGWRPEGAGPASAPRRATVRRIQGGREHDVCDEHARLRKEAGDD